ncbi:hypothetical protein GCM10027048_30130 [Hymenobacter coalescens]
MSSSVLVAKKFAAREYAWKLVMTLLRQPPKEAGEYHIVPVNEVFADLAPNYEQLQRITDEVCRMTIHVVDVEEDDHTFMPVFHSIGWRDTAEGGNVVARFHIFADAELYLLRQGLSRFTADIIPTTEQLNAAIGSEGISLTLKMGR